MYTSVSIQPYYVVVVMSIASRMASLFSAHTITHHVCGCDAPLPG